MSLKASLERMISQRGPISIASYMQQCLTHPQEGYYVTRDPLGARGDFITSPEISQMFGELIGINILTQWIAHGQPSKIRLAELGPGRGTLMSDMLRACRTFKPFYSAIEHVALVEASPELQKKQFDSLQEHKSSMKIDWFDFTRELPTDSVPTFVVAHEFFDALPIHQFEKHQNGNQWMEKMVGIDEKTGEFQFVLNENPSTVMSAVLQAQPRYKVLPPLSQIEVCPEGMEVAQELSTMLKKNSGGALIVDYGPMATIPLNSFRGFKEHHQVNPLEVAPGQADLTADVDFRGLADVFTKNRLNVSGPVSQRDWLHRMGIGARATVLADNQKSEDGKKRIEQAYSRLTDGNGMGKTYKFMAASTLNAPVEGFVKPN